MNREDWGFDWVAIGVIGVATGVFAGIVVICAWLVLDDRPTHRDRCESYCRNNGGTYLSFDALGDYTCAPAGDP